MLAESRRGARGVLPWPAGVRSVEIGASPELVALAQDARGGVVLTPRELGGCGGRQQRVLGCLRAVQAVDGERRLRRLLARLEPRRVERDAALSRVLQGARMFVLLAKLGREGASLCQRAQVRAWLGSTVGARLPSGRLRRMPKAKRAAINRGMHEAGLVGARKRWAVERVLDDRGQGKRRKVLIQWRGFDLGTLESWKPTWEPFSALSSDLQETLGVGSGSTGEAIAVGVERGDGAGVKRRAPVAPRVPRRSPRVAGEVPGEGLR